jgi:hypothetical protein
VEVDRPLEESTQREGVGVKTITHEGKEYQVIHETKTTVFTSVTAYRVDDELDCIELLELYTDKNGVKAKTFNLFIDDFEKLNAMLQREELSA